MAGQINPLSALLGLLVAPQLLQGLTSLYPPFQVAVARKAFGATPNLIPGGAELTSQALKGVVDASTFISKMRESGYSPATAQNMLENSRAYLAALDYITVWRRGKLGEGELHSVLKQQGITPSDIEVLKDATIYYPTPQDLIRFGVRDVFTSTTVQQYGLNEDYPDMLDEAAVKAGLTPEISRQYWAAHWELPSPTQVYDMLHRGILNEEEVKTYLKVADYMPFWRDKLVALSYDPLTRVDVRRMYGMGVLSETQVNRAYQDLGYSQENADLLTQFTVLEAKHGEGNTPATGVLAAYKAGTMSKGEALFALEKSGLSPDLANTQLDTVDANLRQELIDLEADAIADNYARGHITKQEFQTQLTQLGVPARMLQLTVAREEAQARKRAKVATKSDLDSWWRTGVIGSVRYNKKLTDLGYPPADIPKYLAELRLQELSGADKKFPWAQSMRDFNDGHIGRDSLQTALKDIGLDDTTIAELMDISANTGT